MSTKQVADLEDEPLVNPDPPSSPPPDPTAADPAWDGRSSKIALAYPILRDFTVIGPGEPCPTCKARGREDRTHQAHLKTSKDSSGVQRGPEAAHLATLQAMGFLRNSPESRQRAEDEARLAAVRGVARAANCRACKGTIARGEDGDFLAMCPNCGNRNGLPELAALTADGLRRILARDLVLGVEGLQEVEKQQLREEAAKLASAVEKGLAAGLQPLAEMLRELLAERKR